jgi:hypothetical protein
VSDRPLLDDNVIRDIVEENIQDASVADAYIQHIKNNKS